MARSVDPRLVLEMERLKAELEDIERALSIIEEKPQRKYYIPTPGGALIEASLEEAQEYLERRRSKLLSMLKLLRSQVETKTR